MKKIAIFFGFLFISIIIFFPQQAESRSGCCSWHGGVCTYKCPDGVSTGYKCCDGKSLSAKCAPYYPSCSDSAEDYETDNSEAYNTDESYDSDESYE